MTGTATFEWWEAICIAVFWFAFGVMFGIGVTQ